MQNPFGSTTTQKEDVIHNNNPDIPDFADSGYFTKRKILCSVWDTKNGRDVLLKQIKKQYGAKYFRVKIAGKMHRFRIIYDPKIGAIKQGKKYFIYDVHFSNSLGALAFHEYPEKVDSVQADTMLKDGAVSLFIDKGGIPFWWLAICMIGCIVGTGALAVIAPQYVQQSDLLQQYVKQHAIDQSSIQTLQQQIHTSGLGH